jgi:drug/metabolite transporter (DMT)-like permease
VARVAPWFYWVPVFGVGFVALRLGEALSAWHAVGLAAVLAGTAAGTRRG